jgi:hypothetical protein
VRTRGKVAGYSLLICAAAGCLGAVVTAFAGPLGGLVYLGIVACAMPLGRVIWP